MRQRRKMPEFRLCTNVMSNFFAESNNSCQILEEHFLIFLRFFTIYWRVSVGG